MLKGLGLSDQRRVPREPAVLVGVAAPVAAGITSATTPGAPVRVWCALPPPLVVARQAPAAAVLDVVELRQLLWNLQRVVSVFFILYLLVYGD
jgi:hypothetical protein